MYGTTIDRPSAWRSAAAVVLTMIAALPLSAQEAPATALPPAKELITKFVSTTNATAVLAKHTSVRMKGKFEIAAAGVSGDMELTQARPNKSMLHIDLPGIGSVEEGYDGTTAWSVNPMQGPRVKTGRELDTVREELSFGTSSRLGPNVTSTETIEKTELNGESCYKVKIVWKSGRETFDCYSVASGLLVASMGKQETPMGTVDVTNLISDYKDFGGQKIATRLTQQVMGNEQVIHINTIDYDAADATTFQMPAAIKALGKRNRSAEVSVQLLIVRHAIAEDQEAFAATGQADALRPLTADGARKMRRTARGLHEVLRTIDVLVASPFTRAQETAEIIRREYEIERIETAVELEPDTALDDVVQSLSRYDVSVVAIVGHEPQLSRLATYLVAGTERSAVALKKGAACLITFEGRPDRGQGTLSWSIPPGILRDLAG